MPYRLKYDPHAEQAHDALPADVAERLTLALADVGHDPLGRSIPYGQDDGYVRTVLADQALAVILVGHVLKTVSVLQIS